MSTSRSGVSALIGLLVVVIIVAAAFYVTIPIVSNSSTTSSTPGTSSTGSTTTSASGSSSGTLSIGSLQPLIVAPGTDETLTLKLSAVGTVSGTFTLSASSMPKGVTATFQPASVNLPSQLSNGVTLTLSAAAGATVTNATITVTATSGSTVFSSPLPLQSVQALVIIQGDAFKPNSLSVSTGTKVYWLNLDPANNPDLGPDTHDVTALDHSFSSGNGNLGQYDIYSHAFATAGTFKYECQARPSMTGQVTVA